MVKCEYCGEEEGTVTIPNPNFNEDNHWEVCVTCDKIIKEQMNLSFAMILNEKPFGKELSQGMIDESSRKINELAYESGKEVFSVEINKD